MASEKNNQKRGNLNPEPGTYVSVSQLKMYFKCPKQWYFKYVLGIPEPEREYFVLGKKGHLALEYYMKGLDPEKVIEQTAERSHRATIRHALKALYDYEDQNGKINAARVEYEFLTPIYNPHTEKPAMKPLYGFMDVITQEEDILDWKFLAKMPETNPYETDIQTIGYAAAFRSKFGRLPRKIRYGVFEKKTTIGKFQFFDCVVDDWQIEEFWREINRFAKCTKNQEYHKNPNRMCKFCPFYDVCLPDKLRGKNYY